MEIKEVLRKILDRPIDSHKGIFGTGLIVAGSRYSAGCAGLAAKAAFYSGIGKCVVAVPKQAINGIVSFVPEAVYLSQEELLSFCWERSLKSLSSLKACAIGPGLGVSLRTKVLLERTLSLKAPAVIDADAIAFMRKIKLPGTSKVVITPHPKEFSNMTGLSVEAVLADKRALAMDWAKKLGCIIALKGHGTIVTDGNEVYINSTGNAGMATAGSGDVLTGVILAFLSQGLSPFESAALGVYAHGLAGDIAAREIGQVSLTASDIIKALPKFFAFNSPDNTA